MARNAGDEDQIVKKNNEWHIILDDTAQIISKTDEVAILSASITIGMLSASAPTETTLTAIQHGVIVDATSEDASVTLPGVAAAAGKTYTIVKVDDTAMSVFVSGNINGGTFMELASELESVTLLSDGIKYHIVNHVSGVVGKIT